jgi:hypothetical protein
VGVGGGSEIYGLKGKYWGFYGLKGKKVGNTRFSYKTRRRRKISGFGVQIYFETLQKSLFSTVFGA